MAFARHSFIRHGLAAALALALPLEHASATNGMNMEGYGPIATAMGGASMAYDNGTAAMMNNPATLGLMQEGNRADLFLGFLGPDVEARAAGMKAESDGDAYYMPAGGWVQKRNRLTYGLGVYGQGGMGTEYDGDTFLGDPAMLGTSLENRSELSVGRVIFPVAFELNKQLSLGASLSTYAYQVFSFLTYNSEQRPFPFADWPTDRSLVEQAEQKAARKASPRQRRPAKAAAKSAVPTPAAGESETGD